MSGTPGKILVAEDNPALAAVIKFNLQQAGHQVMVVNDGQAALETAQLESFDMIVTDHQMPNLSGVEFCERLRDLKAYQATPILMLTAKALEMDFADLQERLGLCQLLAKPFSPAEVVRVVAENLAPATID